MSIGPELNGVGEGPALTLLRRDDLPGQVQNVAAHLVGHGDLLWDHGCPGHTAKTDQGADQVVGELADSELAAGSGLLEVSVGDPAQYVLAHRQGGLCAGELVEVGWRRSWAIPAGSPL